MLTIKNSFTKLATATALAASLSLASGAMAAQADSTNSTPTKRKKNEGIVVDRYEDITPDSFKDTDTQLIYQTDVNGTVIEMNPSLVTFDASQIAKKLGCTIFLASLGKAPDNPIPENIALGAAFYLAHKIEDSMICVQRTEATEYLNGIVGTFDETLVSFHTEDSTLYAIRDCAIAYKNGLRGESLANRCAGYKLEWEGYEEDREKREAAQADSNAPSSDN